MAEQWYYTVGGQQAGPVSWEELRGLTEQKKLSTADLVWNSTMTGWTEAGKIDGLIPKVPTIPGPPPLPKMAMPPALPDATQATIVSGEIKVIGTGGKSDDGIEYRIEITLDGKSLGQGTLRDGFSLPFTTAVGQHTFLVIDKQLDEMAEGGGIRAFASSAFKMVIGKGVEKKHAFPVGFHSCGHYEVILRGKAGWVMGINLPSEIEVVKK